MALDGGKQYLADRIIDKMPPRCKNPNAPDSGDPGWLHYVEPYAGGLAVLLANDPQGISEVVNDLNTERRLKLIDRKGGDLEELPEDLRIRNFPSPRKVSCGPS